MFKENIERDKKTQNKLKSLGWKTKIVWECELKDIDNLRDKIIDIFI